MCGLVVYAIGGVHYISLLNLKICLKYTFIFRPYFCGLLTLYLPQSQLIVTVV